MIIRILSTLACLIVVAAPALASDDEWKPVDPAELALKTPKVEKDADAEVIFWEVFVNLGSNHVSLTHYIRIKIFTERGRDSQGKVDLTYFGKNKIEDVSARTIKLDGTIVELKKDAIFERVLVKVSGLKLRSKSFALPAVEPGAIIEYRWRESRSAGPFLRLPFQREIPMQSVKYFLKMPSNNYGLIRTRTFNGENISFNREKDNLYSRGMENVHAYYKEPDMPPDDRVRTWMIVYFTPALFGITVNKILYDDFKSRTKLNDELRKTAANIVANAATPEQKIWKLFEFCRSRIKNVNRESLGLTDSDRAALKENKTASDTLKNGIGTGEDINLLFAALATAAGFEARLAKTANRRDFFFDPNAADDFLRLYFMQSSNIAVRMNTDWRFFDPASTFVSYGMLLWQEEGTVSMIVSPVWEEFQATPLSPPESSVVKRTAKLRLSEDGTLEGDVRMEYTGHFSAEKRESSEGDSPQQIEKALTDYIKLQMSTAELSDVHVENLTDPVKPLVESFHIRVPGYGQRTGKRVFFQPALFQHGLGPRFASSERKYEIYFHYPWTEQDELEIDLPAGFALDHAESIGSHPVAEVGKYTVDIGITKDQRTLMYKRNFTFGVGGKILFPAKAYPQLKIIFDTIHELDGHTIALKQGGA